MVSRSIIVHAHTRTPDGTSLLLTTAHSLETYILPPTLLECTNQGISPYVKQTLPESTRATAISPHFDLSRPEQCLYLTSPRDLPIRLVSPFHPDILASFPLVNAHTEAFQAPHSLLFNPRDPSYFFAGTDGLLAVFDLHRPGAGPSSIIRTQQQKRRSGIAGVLAANASYGLERLKGINSALAANDEGLLAVGTFSGQVGMYDLGHEDSAVMVLPSSTDSEHGITSLHFLESQYLIVAARSSCTLEVFDLRNPHQRLGRLCGRNALTQRRLGVDCTAGQVTAGSIDGSISIWQGTTLREGDMLPDIRHEMGPKGLHITGVGTHPLGAGVLAACGGLDRGLGSESTDHLQQDRLQVFDLELMG